MLDSEAQAWGLSVSHAPHESLSGAKLLGLKDLRDRGISYHAVHLNRLIKAGRFPPPLRLNIGGRRFWLASQIDGFLAERARESGISVPTNDSPQPRSIGRPAR